MIYWKIAERLAFGNIGKFQRDWHLEILENCREIGIGIIAESDAVDRPGTVTTKEPKVTRLAEIIGDSGIGIVRDWNITAAPDNDEFQATSITEGTYIVRAMVVYVVVLF